MNGIKLWNYENHEIRTIEKDGEPWFVAKDVATVLGYKNTKDAVTRHVDSEDTVLNGVVIPDPIGRDQVYRIINESGLYSLILSSKLPGAKEFKRWVTSEVLPAIRKTGSYAIQHVPDSYMIDDPVKRAERWIEEQREKQQLLTTVAVQEQQIAELQPKASYYDVVLQCKDLIATSVIAKDYGKSARWLNSYLHDKGVQFKQGGIWLLYQKYAENGYTSTKTCTPDGCEHAKVHTYWTQKGRLFIYDLLKADGILPLIECDVA